ncbi:MAG: phospho-sugar mutase [Flavobacteriales bacterium]|jgi:phosphoglucomutase|tara:strand:- start:26032 stop:27741 length:1710 start_codon:yes stop_codon:yes gene_type:complete
MSYKDKYQEWLKLPFDNTTIEETKSLLNNEDKLEDSFYKNLEFGTGGMRGLMGVGTNRINKYTLGKNTQGLSNYLIKVFKSNISVAIAYDCRNNSKELAKVVADVFSANNIKVYLFSDLRPTPELSFALKHLKCQCGIVLTASHNPPEYNGYKVYWEDGGQIVPPEDQNIINEINKLDYREIKFKSNSNLIEYIDKEVDDVFIKNSIENGKLSDNKEMKNKLNIVFTSLHGTSITLIPEVLKKAGFNNVYIVEEQRIPDGNFPTVKSPNPEETEALVMALKLGNKHNADIVIGTDPDGDRFGIAVRNNSNDLVLLNGNEVMAILIEYLCQKWKSENKLNGNQFIGSTIVSTPLIDKIAKAYNIECKLGLTGFKWIAKMIKDYPELDFIGGGEESFGFMVGDFVRDKDAITSTLLSCEIAALLKNEGDSMYSKLQDIHMKYGLYKEKLISLTKKGIHGNKEINNMMNSFRNEPPKTIGNSQIIKIDDFESSTSLDCKTNSKAKILLPKSNVLIFTTLDGTKVALRPSGTEPKIKFYISVNKKVNEEESYSSTEYLLKNKIKQIVLELKID